MIFVSVFSFKHRGNISVIITVVVFAVVVNVKFFSRSGNGQDIILKWIHYLRAGQANVLKTRTLASELICYLYLMANEERDKGKY